VSDDFNKISGYTVYANIGAEMTGIAIITRDNIPLISIKTIGNGKSDFCKV
jgi:hypothetical protein